MGTEVSDRVSVDSLFREATDRFGRVDFLVAVSPGPVETWMPHQHADWLGQEYETFLATVVSQTPLRRTGTPDDLAAVITSLCSDDASFITGETLVVSGGL